jgi:hypothetical protein
MIMSILHEIQKSIHVPKDKRNDFGEYNYRTAEGILAAVKSILPDGVTITLSDDIKDVAGSIFIKSTATLKSGNEIIAECHAFAGHPLEKKKMDFSQITGASSSYARKYALQGLLALDDSSADPDVTNKHEATSNDRPEPAQSSYKATSYSSSFASDGQGPKLASDKQKAMISALGKKLPQEVVAKIRTSSGVVTKDQWDSMTSFTASKLITALKEAEAQSEPVLDDEIPF